MEFLMDIVFFALLFFILVFIHELGHFLMARWMGVKVEKFSIGMGPALWSKQWGETEYRIAALPLGGYVKMSGDDPSKTYEGEEKARGFLTQTPPKKLVIVFGGPVFNLVLPLFVFALMFMIGVPHERSYVGLVEPNSPAAVAGLLSGDAIVGVDGKPVAKWRQLEEIIRSSPNKDLEVSVERFNYEAGKKEVLSLKVTPVLAGGKSRFGEDIQVGKVGIGPQFKLPAVYFEGDGSPLQKAGLRPFDRVRSVNGMPVTTLEQLRQAVEVQGLRAETNALVFGVERDGATQEFSVPLSKPISKGSTVASAIGLLPPELVVGEVSRTVNVKTDTESGEVAGPAYMAGLREGDRLISIDGKELSDWLQVPTTIQAAGNRDFPVVWSRNGERMEAMIRPKFTVLEDRMLGKDNPLVAQQTPRIGVSPALMLDADHLVEQTFNPITLVKRSYEETSSLISMTATALGKLVTGDLSLRSLGSPIMIFKVAGNSYRVAGGGHHGWTAFLKMLALLSISLGLVNLFPIPVLDGGHATFFILEWIRGKPMSLKFMEISAQVGMIILLGLFGLVLYNDFVRYGYLDGILRFFQ